MISLLSWNLVPFSKKLKSLACRCSFIVSCQEVKESVVLSFSSLYFVNFPYTVNTLCLRNRDISIQGKSRADERPPYSFKSAPKVRDLYLVNLKIDSIISSTHLFVRLINHFLNGCLSTLCRPVLPMHICHFWKMW